MGGASSNVHSRLDSSLKYRPSCLTSLPENSFARVELLQHHRVPDPRLPHSASLSSPVLSTPSSGHTARYYGMMSSRRQVLVALHVSRLSKHWRRAMSRPKSAPGGAEYAQHGGGVTTCWLCKGKPRDGPKVTIT